MKKLRMMTLMLAVVCASFLLTLRPVVVKPKAANPTAFVQQSFVLKRVGEPRGDPPCSTWGDITSCDPNGGSISWGPSVNTTYTWTAPPQQIGPEGISISLSASESNPPDRASATGIKLTASGFDISGGKPDVPIGRQSLSGSANVILKPQPGAGEYSIRIGVYWGPSYVYTYRAERSSNSTPNTNKPTAPFSDSGFNELRVVDLTEAGATYHKGGSAAGAWLPIERNTILKAGDEISTDPDSSVTLAFKGGSTVTLSNLTQLKIASLFTEGGVIRTEILLKMGEVQSKIDKEYQDKIPKSDFRIKTPTDVSSVRGTRFTVRYDARTQVSTTTVEEGVVRVTPTNPSLKPVTLNAGQQVQVAQNRVGPVSSVETADDVERKTEQLRNILGALRGNSSSNGASTSASGRWVGNYTNTKGEAGKSTITINQLADGTITGDEDGWRIENGRRNGNSLTWRYLRQNSGCRNYDVTLQLSNDGQTLTGTYQVTDLCARSTYSGRYVSYRRQ